MLKDGAMDELREFITVEARRTNDAVEILFERP
jgi:hypothetical protein